MANHTKSILICAMLSSSIALQCYQLIITAEILTGTSKPTWDLDRDYTWTIFETAG